MRVRAKKSFGQHFLKNPGICQKIAASITRPSGYVRVLEIGPGTGALTKFLLERDDIDLMVIEVDRESVAFLETNFPELRGRILPADFLKMNLADLSEESFGIVGNFPYNISTQILFKVLENKDLVPEVVGMFQREVAQRVVSPPGSKNFGIISVLIQAYYDCEYLFTVDEYEFQPPPKVKSGVIRLIRNDVEKLDCDEELFVRVVKMGFNQRRKTLRNSLKQLVVEKEISTEDEIFQKRPEQLGVEGFIYLTKLFSQ